MSTLFPGFDKPNPNPDNRHAYIDACETAELVIGSTAVHSFELDFNWGEYIDSGRYIYKQGLDIILDGQITADMIHDCTEGGPSVIIIKLDEAATQKFSDTVLDTYCQLQLKDKSGFVYYDDPKRIFVKMPLKVVPVNSGNEV